MMDHNRKEFIHGFFLTSILCCIGYFTIRPDKLQALIAILKKNFFLKSSDFKDVYFSFSLILAVALFCIFFRGWWFAIESQWSKTKGCDNKELTFAAKLLKSVKSVYSNVLLCIKWSWQFLTILLPNKVLHHVESRELSDEVCVRD